MGLCQALVLPWAAITQECFNKVFLQCLGKGARKSSGDVQMFGKISMHKTITRGMLAMLLNPSWSSPWSPHFSPSLGSRGMGVRKRAGPHPSFLLGSRRKLKARMGLGRPRVGCQRKVSIKAMRASASLCLTARLSGADSRSTGWLPCLAHQSVLPPMHPQLPTSEAGPCGHWQHRGVPCPAPRDAPNNGNYLDLGLKQATASLEADGSRAVGAESEGTGRRWVLLK